MKNILFVCSQNQLRSPTAEQVFADYPGVDAASAGLNRDAVVPVSGELIEWADIIFAMEAVHRDKLRAKFQSSLKNARIICLEIPDDYNFMDDRLVRLLNERVTPHLK